MSKLKLSLTTTLDFFKSHLRASILVGLLVLTSTGAFFNEKARVMNFPTNQISDDLDYSDCGVVLTGSPGRIRESFEVLNQKKIGKLIVSGVYKDTKLIEIFPHLNFYSSIDPNDIILEKISGSTYGNAIQSQLVAETLHCNSILLMTSEIHMYRAYRMFEAVMPKTVKINKYHIINTAKGINFLDVIVETTKSVFYNLIIFFYPYI